MPITCQVIWPSPAGCATLWKMYDFWPLPNSPQFLQTKLAKLNASGTMGGDPLNKLVQTTDHMRAARIPITEGLIFPSKERTSVLLLVEINDEGVECYC
jgi:hypothetical protein